jgi:hypothetical protein
LDTERQAGFFRPLLKGKAMKLFSLLPLLFLGCVNLTASDSVSVEQSVSIPVPGFTVPAGLTIPAETLPTQSVQVDFSDVISHLNNVGTPSFAVEESQVSSPDLSFFGHIEIDCGSLTLIDADVPSGVSSAQFPVLASDEQVLNCFSVPTTLSFTLTTTPLSGSVPAQSMMLDYTLVLLASETVNKGL